jgi:hypothetical protein
MMDCGNALPLERIDRAFRFKARAGPRMRCRGMCNCSSKPAIATAASYPPSAGFGMGASIEVERSTEYGER